MLNPSSSGCDPLRSSRNAGKGDSDPAGASGMTDMKWRKFVPIVILGLPVIGVTSCIVRDDRLDTDFKAVEAGMTLRDVERTIGSPSWNSDCGHGRLPEVSKPANCAKELGYSATLAWTGFAPMWWVVWLGTDGMVIRTAKIVSP
jgi:hypothetical protein